MVFAFRDPVHGMPFALNTFLIYFSNENQIQFTNLQSSQTLRRLENLDIRKHFTKSVSTILSG